MLVGDIAIAAGRPQAGGGGSSTYILCPSIHIHIYYVIVHDNIENIMYYHRVVLLRRLGGVATARLIRRWSVQPAPPEQ